ncbi:MAG: protein-tyrosine phosphatase family protein [Gammaproteobacteria bacterium]
MKISWLPNELIETGRLGLTHSPGVADTTRDQDLATLKKTGVQRIVCLQEAFEMRYSDMDEETIVDREQAVNDFGMRFTHFPIPDHGVGSISEYRELVTDVRADLEKGATVAVHCFAGLGRAGTLAACVLVADGMNPKSAILEVRDARPGAIQSEAQEKFILGF